MKPSLSLFLVRNVICSSSRNSPIPTFPTIKYPFILTLIIRQTSSSAYEGSCAVSSGSAMNQSSDSAAAKDPSCHESVAERILPHILNIYGSRGTASDFEIYGQNATFEDPLMCANGVKQIKSAFYSIPKIFRDSSIVEYTMKETQVSPGKHEIDIDNKQHYNFLGRDIHMISLIKLYLEQGKVVRHEDRWDKKPLANRETVSLPLLGRFLEAARRGSMFATHALMGFGKDPS